MRDENRGGTIGDPSFKRKVKYKRYAYLDKVPSIFY